MSQTEPIAQPINVYEYEALARGRLSRSNWDYFEGGSDDEVTLRANSAAFQSIQIRPRVLVDVSACQTDTRILGTRLSMPILVAPLGCQGIADPEGECATARAAAAAGTLMVVSTMSTRSLEEVAAAEGPRWFQLYVYRDRAITEALVRRAEEAGYQALVVTVDTPQMGRRERDIRNQFGLPPHLRFANFETAQDAYATGAGSALIHHAQASFDASLSWGDIRWLQSITRLPIILKGIMTAEDALQAVAAGVEGIIVSNHGGRQLDGVPATIEILPEVAAAVDGRCALLLDGGVRRGTDVLKALALGADAVLVGRPVLWGLTAQGEPGARRVLELLRAELELAMRLAGCPTLAQITPASVRLASEPRATVGAIY